MKSFKFLLGAFCAIGMIACSNSDDVDEGGGTTPDGTSQNLYLSVNVMAANEGTRATYINGEPDNAQYEKGEGDENKVENAYFYFFDAEGRPANVVKDLTTGENVNYKKSLTIDAGSEIPNVEKILESTVVINTTNEELIPVKIVAILNLNIDDHKSKSLDDLSKIVKDYRLDETDNLFVMSSSVYSKEGAKMMAVDGIKEAFKPTEAEARDNPVDIYVERVLAKVSVGVDIQKSNDKENITLENGETLYYTGNYTGTEFEDDGASSVENCDVYVKFLGWNIATETTSSYLFKNINPAWTDNDLGIINWTWPNYYRSFWAMNPEEAGTGHANHSLEDASFKVGSVDESGNVVYGTGDNINYTYVQENASPFNAEGTATALTNRVNETEILVAGQLVKSDGTPFQFAEWKGLRSDTIGVFKAMANYLSIFYKDPENENRRLKIDSDMMQFVTEGNDTYVQLKESAKSNTFYLSKNAEESATIDKVNSQLKAEIGKVKVWKEGLTYYNARIRHLGKITPATEDREEVVSVGAYGVVRNHSYQVVISGVKGFGTPVYDPDEVIIPEQPEEESYLAARIKVLSWRVVKSTVDLK